MSKLNWKLFCAWICSVALCNYIGAFMYWMHLVTNSLNFLYPFPVIAIAVCIVLVLFFSWKNRMIGLVWFHNLMIAGLVGFEAHRISKINNSSFFEEFMIGLLLIMEIFVAIICSVNKNVVANSFNEIDDVESD